MSQSYNIKFKIVMYTANVADNVHFLVNIKALEMVNKAQKSIFYKNMSSLCFGQEMKVN